MPGNDQTLARQQAGNELATAITLLAKSNDLATKNTAAVLIEQFSRLYKKPSVFSQSNGYQSSFQYDLIGGDPSTVAINNHAGVGGLGEPLTVLVLPLQDCHEVRFKAYFTGGINPPVGEPFFMFALSPLDSNNPIPAAQFSLLRKATFGILSYDIGFDIYAATEWFDEIPCSGNKYIHILGAFPGANDLGQLCSNSADAAQGGFTLDFIK